MMVSMASDNEGIETRPHGRGETELGPKRVILESMKFIYDIATLRLSG